MRKLKDKARRKLVCGGMEVLLFDPQGTGMQDLAFGQGEEGWVSQVELVVVEEEVVARLAGEVVIRVKEVSDEDSDGSEDGDVEGEENREVDDCSKVIACLERHLELVHSRWRN